MKIIIVGGTGTIGSEVASLLGMRHNVITAGREHCDVKVNITDSQSIQKMYESIGKFDAVIATTGNVHFAPLAEMTEDQFFIGLKSKLMGQVNLVTLGLPYINDAGSFTLTSGVLSHDPIPLGASAAMVNGAIDSFVTSAAIEMTRNIRINVVSPTVITESMINYAEYFRGFNPVPVARVALAYIKSVEGKQTGQIYSVI